MYGQVERDRNLFVKKVLDHAKTPSNLRYHLINPSPQVFICQIFIKIKAVYFLKE